MLEHRHCNRIPTAVRTLIHHQGAASATGIARNLSFHGAFIEISGAALLKGTGVEVEFIGGTMKELRLRGLIVHVNDKGAGIMFSDSDTAMLHALKKAIMQLRGGNAD